MANLSIMPMAIPLVPCIDGQVFPVRRVFCVGKNYADHVAEMGSDARKDPPVYFTKPVDAVIVPDLEAPDVPYPPRTENLHFEGELVIAMARGGADIVEAEALSHVYGYAVGCDLTRRDLQKAAKDRGAPWDMAKGFDHSAVIGHLTPGAEMARGKSISLSVNGQERQAAPLDTMIYSVAQIIADLSTYVALAPGDLIYTGTPAGVGALSRGDRVAIRVDGLAPLDFSIS
ncbi:fumarylacetoacetate hydrolase family protein [Parvularcula sp. LCG005]|uniref:fumarylacetoacetate hydrolase family protein n=1 Tax=Parvularcula sp. LCG005 TaxID=3078805 RepID=UPI002941CE48|nr:fumarylacetoacetate hydrolase family protein [Parvularcula sp. LCG005]WOI53702.1 fumarylacetoacetate hydrolase family protein [Parvularcula sp. LCG005]